MSLKLLVQEGTESGMETKCKTFCEDLSESLHILNHDPSLAVYRIQEHMRKSLPQLIEKRVEVSRLHDTLQGICFDLENDIEAVAQMEQAGATFARIHDLLKSSTFHKQQLDYERSRRQDKSGFYQSGSELDGKEIRKTRSMGHIKEGGESVPDTPLSRSTTSTPVSELPSFVDLPSSPSDPMDDSQPNSRAETPIGENSNLSGVN